MQIEQRAKYSNVFIWIGVLAWVPYIAARLIQIDISAIPFLAVHLIGVLGGILLRHQDPQNNAPLSKKTKRLKTISTVLLVLGVSVWGVYFGLEWLTGTEREVTPFLIAHLSGVLTGAGIKLYNFFNNK
jgi:hypothetical protein